MDSQDFICVQHGSTLCKSAKDIAMLLDEPFDHGHELRPTVSGRGPWFSRTREILCRVDLRPLKVGDAVLFVQSLQALHFLG